MATNEQAETIEPPKPLAPQEPRKPRDTKRILWNVLTLLVLLLTLCACCYFVAIFANPNLSFNPFPPEEQASILVLPTATWTPLSLGATWTPSVTPPPVEQPTRRPTFTPISTNTPVKLYTDTPTETTTPEPPTPEPTGVPFSVTVKYVDSSIMHPESSCDFFGVGGSVFDLQGNPFKGMVIKLEGSAGGNFYSQLTVSGTAPAYGAERIRVRPRLQAGGFLGHDDRSIAGPGRAAAFGRDRLSTPTRTARRIYPLCGLSKLDD